MTTTPRDLYGLPLDRFTAERTALAKELRAAGDREQAAEVAVLRKPSVAAWAVNQLVRTQKRAVAELFKAGDQLQRAQSELLAGRGDTRALQAAVASERTAAEQLTETARGLLSSEGQELSSATLERVRETLHAAALDPAARTEVGEGSLVRELRHVGIGDAGVPIAAAKRTTRKPTKPGPSGAVRKATAEARRAAERAERSLRVAQERRDHAAAALEAAESALLEANERVERAKHALDEATHG